MSIYLIFILIKIVISFKSTKLNSFINFPIIYINNKRKKYQRTINILNLVDNSIKSNDHIIKLTSNAENKIKELANISENNYLILKLLVKNGGCKGLQYKLNSIKKNEIKDDDYIQQFNDLKFILVIDATSVMYIFNNTLDYSNDLINGGFKFINPNATKKCGCGKSFNV